MCFSLHDNDSDDGNRWWAPEYTAVTRGGDKNYLHKKGFFFAISQQGANIKERAANNQKKTQSNKQACIKSSTKRAKDYSSNHYLMNTDVQLNPIIPKDRKYFWQWHWTRIVWWLLVLFHSRDTKWFDNPFWRQDLYGCRSIIQNVHRTQGVREEIQVVQLQKVRKLIWNWKIETKSSATVPVFICNHKAAAVYKSHRSVRREHCWVKCPVATSGRKGETEFFL